MKLFKYFLSAILIVTAIWSCTDEDFGSLDFLSTAAAPTNVDALFNVTQDNTGTVTITPNSEGAVSYDIFYGDNTSSPGNVKQGKSIVHVYNEGTYTVKIVAIGITGLTTEKTHSLVVSFKAPENLVVVIQNDAAVSKKVNVTATADFAILFEVYFGEEGNDEPVLANNGGTASYTYQEAGTYTIRVVSKSAAIQTTEYTEEFVVTEILQPITKAPEPPARVDTDVVSIFSNKYTNIGVSEWNPNWGQSTVLSSFVIDGDNILKYDFLNYTGIVTNYGTPTNLSAMEYVHFDYWTNDAGQVAFKIVNTSQPNGSPLKESEVVELVTDYGKWVSVNIPLTDFTTDMSGITQLVLSSTGVTVFIDNIYFYRAPSQLMMVHDDFEGTGNITTWAGDACGMDNAFANPFKQGINTSNTVLEYSDTGGQYANIRFDVPQNFELATKNKFSLKIYVPSSSITGSQTNKISLKLQDGTAGQPWAQQTEIIKPIVLDQWQTIEFDFANDVTAGAANPLSRTDFNRVVLQVNGENNFDSVKAYIDDFNYHN